MMFAPLGPRLLPAVLTLVLSGGWSSQVATASQAWASRGTTGRSASRYSPPLAQSRGVDEALRTHERARELAGQGSIDEAIALEQRALELMEKAAGRQHPDVGVILNDLAELYRQKGDYKTAEPLYQRALAIHERVAPDNPYTAIALTNLGLMYTETGDYDSAGPLLERAVEISERALGPDHPQVGATLNNLADLYSQKGDYARAGPLFERALAIAERDGRDLIRVGLTMNNLALLYGRTGDYARAETMCRQAQTIFEKTIGPEHPYFATTLHNLAELLSVKADYAQAEALYQRALKIYEKALGADSLQFARSLNNLAGVYERMGEYARAETNYRRSLAIRERALGARHPDLAESYNNLATLYGKKADYAQEELLLRRALKIVEDALGADHPHAGLTLVNLANAYRERGDYIRAEPLYGRALTIFEKALGPDHANVALTLNGLALLYKEKGAYANAEQSLRRAIKIYEKTRGPAHPDTALTLTNLAGAHYQKGNFVEAASLYERAVAIFERSLGPNHAHTAIALAHLGKVYDENGDHAKAEQVFRRVQATMERVFGRDHPQVAGALEVLGTFYVVRGDYAKAEPMLRRSLEIKESVLGVNHPDVASALGNLAVLHEGKGNIARAIEFQQRADEIIEHNLALMLDIGSELEKRLYLKSLSGEADATISLHAHVARDNPAAAQLALTTILRRKGRTLDIMTDHVGSLRRRAKPQDHALLDELSAARSRLASLLLRGTAKMSPEQYKFETSQLKAEVEGLEHDVSRHGTEPRERVTLARVQQAIPDGFVLVEIVSYTPFNTKAISRRERFGAARYAAYVLRRTGAPAFADLGPAAPINQAVTQLRSALSDPKSMEVKRAARALDDIVMRPVRRLLGGTHNVLLSPDGELNLIPFGALVDERGRYLVEDFSITYLTSGRDLLRLGAPSPHRQQPMVIADPAFDLAVTADGQGPPAADTFKGKRSVDFSALDIKPLPGTGQEATVIKRIVPAAEVLTGRSATESALKRVTGPRFLHIATHGFFLNDQAWQVGPSARQFVMDEVPHDVGGENPLLRSGLVLAGVKRGQSGAGEDGVLTALEASALDLWGTKLVVLSACETGVGDVVKGEGVYGLRRALVLAGAESQVMSLWKVSDSATKDLMAEYYLRLARGEGRAEALRAVQLEMQRGNRSGVSGRDGGLMHGGAVAGDGPSRPYYWAAFIQSGDWRGLDGQDHGRAGTPSLPVAETKQPLTVNRPTLSPPQTQSAKEAAPRPTGNSAQRVRLDDVKALTAAGDVKFDEGDFTAAASFYERALATRPNDAGLRARFGDTFSRRATPDYDRAIAEYRRALAIDSKNERAWQGIASAAIRKGNSLVARDAINELTALNPANPALPRLRSDLENLRRPLTTPK